MVFGRVSRAIVVSIFHPGRLFSPAQTSAGFRRHLCFKSKYSLDNLYSKDTPLVGLNCQQDAHSSRLPGPSDFTGEIPLDDLIMTFSKASGPGGQHVNKVNTKVDIRFHVDSAGWIPEGTRERLKVQERNRITKDGCLVFSSDKTRKQLLNRADCLEKIRAAVRLADKKPRVASSEEIAKKEARKATADKARVEEKRRNSLKASYRGSASIHDL